MDASQTDIDKNSSNLSIHSLDLALDPCAPPSWAKSPHAQTLLGHFLPSQGPSLRGERTELRLPDGDRLVMTYHQGRSPLVLYLFHGLGGTAQAGYMRRTCQVGMTLGHHVFTVNHRGCGEGMGLASAPYHSGRSEDLSAAIAEGRRRFPRHRHLAIGFSLSGNAVLLLAAGVRAPVLPDAAIAVNAPICLETASRRLHQGFNRVYDLNFMLELRNSVRSRAKAGLLERTYSIPRLATIFDFDQLYTAPEGGFKSREDYYGTCSAKNHLADLKVPTVLLTAADDPFVAVRHYRDARLSPHARLHIEEHGGHMGYVTSRPTALGTRRWLDYALHRFIHTFAQAWGGPVASR